MTAAVILNWITRFFLSSNNFTNISSRVAKMNAKYVKPNLSYNISFFSGQKSSNFVKDVMHYTLWSYQRPLQSLQAMEKNRVIGTKHVSFHTNPIKMNSTWLTSSLDCMGKRNTLKFGDFGHVVGGGLRIICLWISGNVRGSTSRSAGNS